MIFSENRFPLFRIMLEGSRQAETREGSSTIEKRAPALWRFSSETARQASSASLRVLNGPCTWAEPSTSLWKFMEPNSPPITQKLLFVMVDSYFKFNIRDNASRNMSASKRQNGEFVQAACI